MSHCEPTPGYLPGYPDIMCTEVSWDSTLIVNVTMTSKDTLNMRSAGILHPRIVKG